MGLGSEAARLAPSSWHRIEIHTDTRRAAEGVAVGRAAAEHHGWHASSCCYI